MRLPAVLVGSSVLFPARSALVGHLTLPAPFEVFDIGRHDVAGVMTDTLGVEHVQLLPVGKGGGA